MCLLKGGKPIGVCWVLGPGNLAVIFLPQWREEHGNKRGLSRLDKKIKQIETSVGVQTRVTRRRVYPSCFCTDPRSGSEQSYPFQLLQEQKQAQGSLPVLPWVCVERRITGNVCTLHKGALSGLMRQPCF
mmetsp:Transcript_16244/g.32920  ORF Transcript_16244/g.32920 Transcript_16244/m.32920 type:complete len:130 (-) Transcript_16244:194-583(-)